MSTTDSPTEEPTPTDPDPAGRQTWGAWRWVIPALVVLIWIGIGGPLGAYSGKLSEVQKNDNAAYLPASAEATEVDVLQKKFVDKRFAPAVVVYERESGLTAADFAHIAADIPVLQGLPRVVGKVIGPIPEQRPGGLRPRAAEVIVPVDAEAGLKLSDTVDAARDQVQSHGSLTAHVTGPAGIFADFGKAFGRIDGLLLVVTGLMVLLILVVVYRSPLLPMVVLLTAGLALGLAAAVVYQLAAHEVLTLNGQSQGILFILVIGACTDYSLLLIARFREELRRHDSKYAALRVAYRAAFAPITASGGTVVLGVLCLLFSDLRSNQGLGPVAAIGIGASLVAALTFLPAVLALLGRSAFWPFRPAYDSHETAHSGVWARVAALVGRHPHRVWISTALPLLFFAAFLPQLKSSGVAQTDLFLTPVDSVAGQEVVSKYFSAGSGSPARIIAKADHLPAVIAAARSVRGIDPASVAPVLQTSAGAPPGGPGAAPKVVDGLAEIQATFTDPADGEKAIETLGRLRTAVRGVEGADAKVGGITAINADTQATSIRDRVVIIPIVLLVIFLVLMVLLRSIVAPVLLVSTVVLSFAATLGVSALVFDHLFGFPGSDPAIPLFGFVFLVALGIDYNIFLMTRVREESQLHGTREGTLIGLRVTGGVITSAGVVLAATFAALSVLPILFLAQIAFIVAFGVLLDALVVRSLLVPALTVVIGRRIWWPSALSRGTP